MMSQRRPLPKGYVGELVASFTELEVAIAIVAALAVHLVLAVGFLVINRVVISAKEEPPEKMLIPIAVKPVLDETKLLKLGGKKPVKYKLPDMWQKKAPIVRREKAASAPSPDAKDDPAAIPDAGLVAPDAEAPAPDAEVAKEVDELQPDATMTDAEPEPEVEGEGSPDGVKEGTETDPLKARAVSQYTMKILGWFNARFTPPTTGAPCEELKKLSAGVAAQVGGDRTVTSYTIIRPSGNPTFDATVKATMDAIVGQQLPPPPPLYPDILGSTVTPSFSGQRAQCEASPNAE